MTSSKKTLNPETVLRRFTKFDTQPEAETFLKKMIRSIVAVTLKHTTCAVFDIDGTILRDRGDEKLHPLCNRMLSNLFKLCREHEIPVFIITARPEGREQRRWTVDQLTQCGYPPGSYAELNMMPLVEWKKLDQGADWNFSDYKYRERQRIAQQNNKTIILNAGDQWTDLLRVPPCSKSKEERITYDAVKNLPNRGVYVGSLVDLSWISVKLPH